ncbi:MAG: LamB/YcsF family protein [Opitutales bacterium]|jgi:5-oxoprolinase (ATP-hydrolysing) subunit A|nr:LamB/YcsF family protein [Opitutales bacterium]MDP4643083.1 LamB/YcsF family protein [Opitutales bacterium]MDP4776771.1 LamB/YcsF family protein [Opitutales bacterium]MDP4882882.1 LamB/YcsF family protein [Opitutales bacterium]MDP5080409.1 LamB/YcsF family protein [Opitutales bacterium]
MARLILNCDLGENESLEQTAALLAQVGAANICCGVHAGSLAKTTSTIQLASEAGVMIGAHPGLAGSGGRGGDLPISTEFEALLAAQVDGFCEAAAAVGADVRYVKLHGSLYHAVEVNADLRAIFLQFMGGRPELGLFVLAGGLCAREAAAQGIQVWAEAFVDRGYLDNGGLVPRGEPGAILGTVEAVERVRQWLSIGQMSAIGGATFPLQADTLCVHADSPGAVDLLVSLRAEFTEAFGSKV